jgi:carboxymethylenebutenolidase
MNPIGNTFNASDGVSISVYRAVPPGQSPRPGLLVAPSILGITDELIAHADEIASTGVVVVAFDPFARGDDPGPLGDADRERAFARMAVLDFKRMDLDFRELLADLKSDPACNGRVAGLGVCLGAPFVFNAAADGELAAAAFWHASRLGGLMGRAGEIRCPMLIEFGDADPIAPIEEVLAIRDAFADACHVQVRVYPGAGHGFSHTGWKDHDPAAMAEARPALEKLLAELRNP